MLNQIAIAHRTSWTTGKLVRPATLDLAFTPGYTSNCKRIETHFFEHPS